jgi:hypothetical protein
MKKNMASPALNRHSPIATFLHKFSALAFFVAHIQCVFWTLNPEKVKEKQSER